jgi:drug/metabolite transporter (DMT)-like permease
MKKIFVIGLMLVCTLFTSIGQLLFKLSSETFELNFSIFTNYFLFLGLISYAIGVILMILALKNGKLSFLYPFVSLTFIWVMLISSIFLNENINSFKINAVFLIIFGVVLIGGSE